MKPTLNNFNQWKVSIYEFIQSETKNECTKADQDHPKIEVRYFFQTLRYRVLQILFSYFCLTIFAIHILVDLKSLANDLKFWFQTKKYFYETLRIKLCYVNCNYIILVSWGGNIFEYDRHMYCGTVLVLCSNYQMCSKWNCSNNLQFSISLILKNILIWMLDTFACKRTQEVKILRRFNQPSLKED